MMKDAKLTVLSRLLEMARLIRRRGTPDEAAAVLPYEQQLQGDFEKRAAELATLPGLERKEPVPA